MVAAELSEEKKALLGKFVLSPSFVLVGRSGMNIKLSVSYFDMVCTTFKQW